MVGANFNSLLGRSIVRRPAGIGRPRYVAPQFPSLMDNVLARLRQFRAGVPRAAQLLGADRAQLELEGPRLAIRDDESDLPHARGVERRRSRDRASAVAREERGQRQPDRREFSDRRHERCLVADAVERVVGAQRQLVALAIAAGLEYIGSGAGRAEVAGGERTDAKPPPLASATSPVNDAYPSPVSRNALFERPPITRSSTAGQPAMGSVASNRKRSRSILWSRRTRAERPGASGCGNRRRSADRRLHRLIALDRRARVEQHASRPSFSSRPAWRTTSRTPGLSPASHVTMPWSACALLALDHRLQTPSIRCRARGSGRSPARVACAARPARRSGPLRPARWRSRAVLRAARSAGPRTSRRPGAPATAAAARRRRACGR